MGTSSLKQHKRTHADERPFECSECKRKFRYRKNLKIHMIALHNGERLLQCSFCGKKFYAPKDLKIHERTHTGLKPYSCHLCPKRFNIKEHLTMHIRVHTGERPYKCPICDKSFSQANSLRIHKKIHTKSAVEKPQKNKRLSSKANKGKVLNSTGGNDTTSVSTFQLMVPTMQTVTAAIVSLSTVTSPFPNGNLPQPGNENSSGQTSYAPLMGSLEGSSINNEKIEPSLVTQSYLAGGDSSTTLLTPDSKPILSGSAPPLENLNSETNYTEKDASCVYQNLN